MLFSFLCTLIVFSFYAFSVTWFCKYLTAFIQPFLIIVSSTLQSNDVLVIPALNLIKRICQLFPEAPAASSVVNSPSLSQKDIIVKLQTEHTPVTKVTDNLVEYMSKAKAFHLGMELK